MREKITRRKFLKVVSIGSIGTILIVNELSQLSLLAQIPYEPEPKSILLSESNDFQLSDMFKFNVNGIKDEYPSITIDNAGKIWVVLVSESKSGEGIYLTEFVKNEFKDIKRISDKEGLEFQPEIVSLGKDLFVVWSAKRNGNWQIVGRMIKDGNPQEELVISDGKGINWRPALTADNNGNIWIVWERKIEKNFEIVARVMTNGKLSELTKVSNKSNLDNCRPAIVCDKEGKMWVAYDRYIGEGNIDVYLKCLSKKDNDDIRVSYHPAIDIAPSLAVDDENRIWIGWHSNRKGEDKWDLPKWFQLISYKDGEFYDPVKEPKDKDLKERGTIQGFEFIKVFCTNDGKVCVTGRPSHNFDLQYYQGEDWSSLYRFPKDGWGGRGQYMKVSIDPNGDLWVVRRDLDFNVLQKVGKFKGEKKNLTLNKFTPPEVVLPLANISKEPFKFDPLEGFNFYFGDIHSHSWLSDGMGDVDEFYIRSRDYYKDDFGSLTDHDTFVGNSLLPSEWEYIKEITTHFNEEGKFVTLYGQEWTTGRPPKGFGHKNIYHINPEMPLLDHTDEESNSTKKIFEQIKRLGAIAIPHHIGWTGVDWENADPNVMPLVEVVSSHGAYEYLGNQPIPHRGGMKGCFIQDGLGKGLKFGIVGGSDCHGLIWHHRVGWKRDSARTGLTCVLAKELTREAIFEAMKKRRVYATSGVKMRISFMINGHFIGEEFSTNEKPNISIDVLSPEELKWLIIVKNNKDVNYYGGEGFRSFYSYVDNDIEEGESFYYLRVITEKGNMAWTSPIWVSYKA